MNIDRKIMESLRCSSIEEQRAILKLFDLTKHEPNTKLLLAIFRDSFMFREMTQALVLNQKIKINELENEIKELNLRVLKLEEKEEK